MAYSKTTLTLALVFAVMLVIGSHVSARELAETTQTIVSAQVNSVQEAKHHEHGHGHEHEKGHGKGYGKPGHGKGKGKGYGKPGHGDAETESDEN